MLTKRNKVERMTIVNTLLTGIYEELLKGETDDIDGLLQIAVYAQVEMNRIVFDLNQRNGCEPIADTPQTEHSAYDTCQWYNSGIPCGVELSVCKREVTDTPQCDSCEHKHEMGLPCYHCPTAVDCG